MICQLCKSKPAYEYSPQFVELWETARAWFPLLALPESKFCLDCVEYKLQWAVVRDLPKDHPKRKEFLRSSTPIPTLNMNDPEVKKMLRLGAAKVKRYKKELQKERERKRREWMRRFLRRLKREEKQRRKRINAVLEQAAQLLWEREG